MVFTTLALAAAAQCANAATYTVGTGAGCDFDDIQSAIDVAKSNGAAEDTIRLAMGQFDAGQALVIDNADVLIIRGGYSGCRDTTPPTVAEKTLVSGLGGAAASVFAITGNGFVFLEHLVIADGDLQGDGGGIRYRAGGGAVRARELHLRETELVNNDAYNGGAIYFVAEQGQPADLFLHEGVSVLDNEARNRGGGIYVGGAAELHTGAERLFFHRNHARVTGGAISVRRPAIANVGTAHWVQPAFLENKAPAGGAFFVDGDYVADGTASARLRLFSTDATRPMQLVGNAAASGAVMAAKATVQPSMPVKADLCTRAVNVSRSVIGEQAHPALYDYGGGFATLIGPVSFSRCNIADLPYGAVDECAAGVECDVVSGTQSSLSVQNRVDFGLIDAISANVSLDGMKLRENAASAVADLRLGASLRLRDVEITRNAFSSKEFFDVAGPLEVERSTIAANTHPAGAALLRVSDGAPLVADSIVEQPGLPLAAAGSAIRTRNVLVARGEPPRPGHPTVIAGDPAFAGPADFRLSTFSSALDFARATEDDRDADGRTRVVNLPFLDDLFGAMDLGAYELARDDERLLKDGFDRD